MYRLIPTQRAGVVDMIAQEIVAEEREAQCKRDRGENAGGTYEHCRVVGSRQNDDHSWLCSFSTSTRRPTGNGTWHCITGDLLVGQHSGP